MCGSTYTYQGLPVTIVVCFVLLLLGLTDGIRKLEHQTIPELSCQMNITAGSYLYLVITPADTILLNNGAQVRSCIHLSLSIALLRS